MTVDAVTDEARPMAEIHRILLDRPGRGNALTPDLLDGVLAGLDRAASKGAARS